MAWFINAFLAIGSYWPKDRNGISTKKASAFFMQGKNKQKEALF